MTESTKELATKAKQRVKAVGIYRPMEDAPDGGSSFLAVIVAAAADPRCSVEKMQALLDMQIQVEEREAKKAFTLAFMALQEELPNIRPDGKIEIREKDQRTGSREGGRVQQSTPYATFNNIMRVVKPMLTKYGFALSFATEPAGDRLLIKGLLEGYGHQRHTSFPLPAETSGSKNNVQGWGSSMSYGKRYCTIALLNIISEAPEDRDKDGYAEDFRRGAGGSLVEAEDAPKVSRADVEQMRLLMTECGVTEKQALTTYQIKQLEDLPADILPAFRKRCQEHKAKTGHG